MVLDDWRVTAAGITPEDSIRSDGFVGEFPAGSHYAITSIGKTYKGEQISFPEPSVAAFALNVAHDAASAAMPMQASLDIGPYSRTGDIPIRTVAHSDIPQLYDFFEKCMIAALFSFQAVEAYANKMIDHHSREGFMWIDRRGEYRHHSVEELERYVSTENKVGELLPAILKMTTPKGKVVWQDFKKLKQVRDAATHVKSADQTTRSEPYSLPEQVTLLTGFLGADILSWPRAAVNVINYFDRRFEKYDWLQHELDRYGIPRNDKS